MVDLPEYNDGSTPVIIPAGQAGSAARQSAWQRFWSSWGDGKTKDGARKREITNEIASFQNDITRHQADLVKYEQYKARGLNVDQAISGVENTITSLQQAIQQARNEAQSEGITL